jgi:multidrug efflux pump subunit AcrB
MRYDGEPAVGISITNVTGANIVDVGKNIDARLEELIATLPIGIEVHRVHWMSDIVAGAVNSFLINFAEAVAIVLVVIAIGMGLRMSLIIGTALVTTILASFLLMAIFDIDLQRMSLGALIIALGMMVDNAIVVADGIATRVEKGMDRTQAAIEAASQPAWPLLAATIIAVMAFYPIFASTEDAGEYCRTLFTVVAIALLSSWLISMTITPLQCVDMLPAPKEGATGADPYAGGFFRRYRALLETAIRFRFLTIGAMVALLVVALVGFGNVKQLFFPESSMSKFMIDYWAPEGTRIQNVAAPTSVPGSARNSPRPRCHCGNMASDPAIPGNSSCVTAGRPSPTPVCCDAWPPRVRRSWRGVRWRAWRAAIGASRSRKWSPSTTRNAPAGRP